VSYEPSPIDPLYLLVCDLVMGPTDNRPVDVQPNHALLRTPDQVSHLLLLRPGADSAT